MTRTELTNVLSKAYMDYIQYGGTDVSVFFENAINYVEENSELDFDDDAQYQEALEIVSDAIEGK